MPTSKSRRRLWGWVGVAILVLAAVAGWYGWRRWTAPAVPVISLEGVDRSVREAIEAQQEAVRRQPRSGEAWGKLGQLLLAHGFTIESEAAFREAARLDPEEPRWPYLLALRELKRDPEAAVPLLERAIALCDRKRLDNAASRLRLGQTLVELGRFDEAETHFRQALAWAPDDPHAHYGLGLIAAARNDLSAALASLKRAAAGHGVRRKAYIQLAAVYQRSGDRQAAEEFARLAERAPADAEAEDSFLAECLELQTGRKSRAEQAQRLQQSGKAQEAVALLRQLASEVPDDQSYLSLGATLAQVGELDRAEEALNKAIGKAPDNVRAHFFLSLVKYSRGEQMWSDRTQREKARPFFRQAAESAGRAAALKPGHAPALMIRGQSLARLGQDTEAMEALRAAVQARPELPETHLALGEFLVDKGQSEAGIKELELGVELSPPNAVEPRQTLERARKSVRPPK